MNYQYKKGLISEWRKLCWVFLSFCPSRLTFPSSYYACEQIFYYKFPSPSFSHPLSNGEASLKTSDTSMNA